MISLMRLIDFFLDPRMPQYLPCVKLRQLRRKKLSKIGFSAKTPVLTALTFDIESDFGSSASEITSEAAEPFLQKLPALAKELHAVFTLFVQGDLVAGLTNQLRELQIEHEIGLHGYAHELWGKAKWFLSHDTISLQSKQELLKQSLKSFSDNSLAPPTSFRAPDLVVDMDTLRLLEENGFTIDSSASSYYGIPPVPTTPLGSTSRLLSIPITANPGPRSKMKYFIPYTSYEVFNMTWLTTSDNNHFLDYVDEVLKFQVNAGVNPYLVFLAHPWEFKEWANKGKYGYCSSHNYELLRDKFLLLGERYPLKYIKMKELTGTLSIE